MKRYILLAALSMLLASCANDEFDSYHKPQFSEGVTLSVQCMDMLPQVMMSRATESKTAEEKKINRLHLFFFNADGNFLTPASNDFMPYHVANIDENGLAAVTIPKNAFKDQANLTGVQIYAVANPINDKQDVDHTDDRFRVKDYSEDGTICHGSKDSKTAEVTIEKLQDLLDWYYRPAKRDNVTKLPAGGMPMVAHYVAPAGEKVLAKNGNIVLQMKALMARVDVKVRLDANQTNGDGQLPTLQVTEYAIKNMPRCVPFTVPSTTQVPEEDIETEMTVKPDNSVTLKDGQETEVLTFYTYENIKVKTDDIVNHLPTTMSDDDKQNEDVIQRWKPTIAPEGASAFVMKGHYVTHQGLHYDASFNVYLGRNVVDNFEVCRNCCYKNNITIHGLDYVRNSDQEKYTYDGRVNVITDNLVYISIVNERKVDAHASVLPMDIYFLRMEDGSATCNSTVDIELLPGDDGQIPDWIRMEKVSSTDMRDSEYKAGTGARDYFTTDLVTTTLKDNTQYTIHNNYDGAHPDEGTRTRIYFYIDENVPTAGNTSTYGDRKARVRIHYRNDTEDRNRVLEIEQRALLHISTFKNWSGGDKKIDFYIEYYEEYLAHNDPLDQHQMPAALYSGLPWGLNNTYLGNGQNSTNLVTGKSATENYYFGLAATEQAIRKSGTGMDAVKLYNTSVPASAFHYCYGKNKRNADGSVTPYYNADGSINDNTLDGYWEMPGLTDLEKATEQYYATFTDFQGKFYWSACAGSGEGGKIEYNTRARATKAQLVNGSFTHVGSGDTQPYEKGGGFALRTEPLRIRAVYKTKEQLQMYETY